MLKYQKFVVAPFSGSLDTYNVIRLWNIRDGSDSSTTHDW